MIVLHTLGDCAIELADKCLAPDSEVLFSLLTYLIVERGRPISRSVLLEFFWENEEETRARHCLRQSIYKLRQMRIPIETRNDRYLLGKTTAQVDFEQPTVAQVVLAKERDPMPVAIMPGFSPRASAVFQAWLDGVRDAGTAIVRRVLLSAISSERLENRWYVAERLAKQYLTIDPLNEEAHLTLAEALALRGCKSEAIQLLSSYSNDVGQWGHELRIPAAILRRRISESATFDRVSPPCATPLVGRDVALAMLHQLARRAASGAGQTCFIYGDAGIGKTRLAHEFGSITALKGYRIVRVGCRATAASRALSVFMELAPQLLRLPGALGCAPEDLALVRRLAQHTPESPAPNDKHLDAETLHARLRAAIIDLVDCIAAERPLVIVVEDLHWIDPISLSVLQEVVLTNDRRSLLILLTARTDYARTFACGVDPRVVVLHRLEPLSDTDSRTLATFLIESPSAASSVELLDWCVAHGSGNPFFIIELVRHWKDSGNIIGIPPSLEALIDERLEKVSPLALRILQATTLLGKHSSHEQLSVVLSLPLWQLLDGVEELERNGLANSSIDGMQPRHELLARAAVAKLTTSSRSLLHNTIARCLELSPQCEGDATVLWDAATHWSAAGHKGRAMTLARACAEHLNSVGLPFEASEVLREALEFAESSDDKLRIFELRGKYLRQAGSWEGLIHNCESAIDLESRLTPGLGTPHSAFELDFYAAHCAQHSAASADVIGRSLRCVQDEAAPLSHRLAAAASGLIACYGDCRELEAMQLFAAVSKMSATTTEDRKNALLCHLVYHIEYGDLGEATAAGDALLSLANANHDPALIARFLRLSAYPYRMTGGFDVVDERLRRAREVASAEQLYGDYREVLMAEAQQCCAIEDYARAQGVSDELEALFASRSHLVAPTAYLICAEVALMRNELDKADSFLGRLNAYPTTSMRYAGDRLALKVYADLLRERTPNHADVNGLRAAHVTLRGKAGQDFPTASLCGALMRRGERDAAKEIVSAYIGYRRERWPVRNNALIRLLR